MSMNCPQSPVSSCVLELYYLARELLIIKMLAERISTIVTGSNHTRPMGFDNDYERND